MVSPAPILTKPTIFQRRFMKMSCAEFQRIGRKVWKVHIEIHLRF